MPVPFESEGPFFSVTNLKNYGPIHVEGRLEDRGPLAGSANETNSIADCRRTRLSRILSIPALSKAVEFRELSDQTILGALGAN